MLSDIFEQFETLPENIRQIVEAPEKRKILSHLTETYDLPLSMLLMKFFVGEMEREDLHSFISQELSNPTEEENLWYTLEQNFLIPYSLATGKKISERTKKETPPTPEPIIPKIKHFYDFGTLVEKVLERFFEVEKNLRKEIENDPVLYTRLKNILVSHLKDIRDKLETEHALGRPRKIGGMGLQENPISLLLELLSSEKSHLGDYVEEFRVERKPAPEQKETKEKPKVSHEIPTSPPLLSPLPPVVLPSLPKSSLPPSPKKKKSLDKIHEEVVEFRPRLVGPIEELRALTLVDFRRLSPNPHEASKKIKERILGLLKESFQKRILAQRAWEESEVYQLYLFLGKESLMSGKPLLEVINTKLLSGEASLTKDEFDAIMELNNELRNSF